MRGQPAGDAAARADAPEVRLADEDDVVTEERGLTVVAGGISLGRHLRSLSRS